MKKTIVITLCILIIGIVRLNAQPYETGVGVRLGFFNGFTGKHFIADDKALEGIVHFRWGGMIITGLFEIERSIPSVPNLYWYAGAGAHIGSWSKDHYHYYKDDDGVFLFGLTLVGGVEYAIQEAPFSVSLDFMPSINLIGDHHIWYDGVGLSLRYYF